MRIDINDNNVLHVNAHGQCNGHLQDGSKIWHRVLKFIKRITFGCLAQEYGIGVHVMNAKGKAEKIYFYEGDIRSWLAKNAHCFDQRMLHGHENLNRTALKSILKDLLETASSSDDQDAVDSDANGNDVDEVIDDNKIDDSIDHKQKDKDTKQFIHVNMQKIAPYSENFANMIGMKMTLFRLMAEHECAATWDGSVYKLNQDIKSGSLWDFSLFDGCINAGIFHAWADDGCGGIYIKSKADSAEPTDIALNWRDLDILHHEIEARWEW